MALRKPVSLGVLSEKQQPLLNQLHRPIALLMKIIASAATLESLLKAAKQSAAAGAHPSPDGHGALTCPRPPLQKEALAQLRLFLQLPRALPASPLQRSQSAVLMSAWKLSNVPRLVTATSPTLQTVKIAENLRPHQVLV